MAKKLNLTIAQMSAMNAALGALDGRNREVDGKTIYELFKLGAVRLDLGIIANRLKPELDAFEKARQALVQECRKPNGDGSEAAMELKEGHPNWDRFVIEFNKMNDAIKEVDLPTINRADLHLEENELPIYALGAIADLIV
jgi:hypothetical protein